MRTTGHPAADRAGFPKGAGALAQRAVNLAAQLGPDRHVHHEGRPEHGYRHRQAGYCGYASAQAHGSRST